MDQEGLEAQRYPDPERFWAKASRPKPLIFGRLIDSLPPAIDVDQMLAQCHEFPLLSLDAFGFVMHRERESDRHKLEKPQVVGVSDNGRPIRADEISFQEQPADTAGGKVDEPRRLQAKGTITYLERINRLVVNLDNIRTESAQIIEDLRELSRQSQVKPS